MGVRAVETITASRAILFSSNENQAEPGGGQRGLVLALDLDRHQVAHQHLPGRFLLDRVKRETAADALAGLDRGKEADAVEPVIESHLHARGNEHALGRHARQQRQRQEAVGDGPAEPGGGRGLRVDMDELMVLGRVGEGVDARLVDRQPGRNSDLLADAAADLVEAGERHQKGSGAGGWSEARASTSWCAPSRSMSARRMAERLAAILSLSSAESS